MNELEGVLTIKNKEKILKAIVYNDMHKRSQVFYKVIECGAEDIKNLLDELTYGTEITPADRNALSNKPFNQDENF